MARTLRTVDPAVIVEGTIPGMDASSWPAARTRFASQTPAEARQLAREMNAKSGSMLANTSSRTPASTRPRATPAAQRPPRDARPTLAAEIYAARRGGAR